MYCGPRTASSVFLVLILSLLRDGDEGDFSNPPEHPPPPDTHTVFYVFAEERPLSTTTLYIFFYRLPGGLFLKVLFLQHELKDGSNCTMFYGRRALAGFRGFITIYTSKSCYVAGYLTFRKPQDGNTRK